MNTRQAEYTAALEAGQYNGQQILDNITLHEVAMDLLAGYITSGFDGGIDALRFDPQTYTQATIEAALADIGTAAAGGDTCALFLRSGTWVISSNADWSAYTNVTFKIMPGAVVSHGAFTLNIPNPDAGHYTWLSGTGDVTFSGQAKTFSAMWMGYTAAGLSKMASSVNLSGGGTVELPEGYNLSVAAGTKISWYSKVNLHGKGRGSKIGAAALKTVPLIELDAVTDVTISNVYLTHNNYVPAVPASDRGFPLISITGNSARINIKDNFIDGLAAFVTGSDSNVYRCIENHTSAAAKKPITGADWEDYWVLDATGTTSGAWVTATVYNAGAIRGIYIEPQATETVERVNIEGNFFTALESPIILGTDDITFASDTTRDIRIVNNDFLNNLDNYDRTVGVHVFKNAHDIIIANNKLKCFGNCIGLTHGGNRISITGNQIENGDYGIAFDANIAAYPIATYGFSAGEVGTRFTISGNIIKDMQSYGIGMFTADGTLPVGNTPSSDLDWPYGVSITGNEISRCNRGAMILMGAFISIVGNTLDQNTIAAGAAGMHVVKITGVAALHAHDIAFVGNTITNGGGDGAGDIGLYIDLADRVTVIGNVITNKTLFEFFFLGYGIQVGTGSCTQLTIQGNTIQGMANDPFVIDDSAEVIGESVSTLLPTTDATVDAVYPIFAAPHRCYMLNASLVNAATVEANAVNYTTLTLKDRGATGTDNNTIGYVSNGASPFTDFDAVYINSLNTTHRLFAKGDVATIQKSDTLTGAAITNMMCQLNYVTY